VKSLKDETCVKKCKTVILNLRPTFFPDFFGQKVGRKVKHQALILATYKAVITASPISEQLTFVQPAS
jgi:folate-dependent phosphoribosylglycinamide formyltransferase PurN